MTATTVSTPEAWSPNVVSTFSAEDRLADALLIETSTKAGEISGDEPTLLVPYLSAGASADFVAEGEPIELSDIAAAQLAVSTFKIAVVTRVSRELTEQPGAASRIADSLRRSVTARADAAYLSNVSDPTGLLEVAGVETAGDIGENLFAVYEAIAKIEADGGEASHILVHPLSWAHLSKMPTSTGSNESLLANVHEAGERRLAGVKVIVSSAVTEGVALVLDKSEVVSAYGTLNLARSEDAFFMMDAVAIRATWRVGWGIVRPARLQKLTISTE